MARVELLRSDITLVADVSGSEHEPTALLLHAGGENRSVWKPISAHLVGAGWRTIAPDLRGHGESSRASQYRLDDLIEDVASLIKRFAGQPLVVIGGSIGGAVGMLLAGEREISMRALVLLDVPTAPRPESAQRERERVSIARSRGNTALTSLDPGLMDGDFVDTVLADLGRWRRAARSVVSPTLLVRGKRSHAVGPQEVLKYREDIPHGQLAELDSGHLVARDQPKQLSQLLECFLRPYRQA